MPCGLGIPGPRGIDFRPSLGREVHFLGLSYARGSQPSCLHGPWWGVSGATPHSQAGILWQKGISKYSEGAVLCSGSAEKGALLTLVLGGIMKEQRI